MKKAIRSAKEKARRVVDRLRPPNRRSQSPEPADPVPIPAAYVIHELLAAARDEFDLCLPLQAALTGVVNIWDVCQNTAQLTGECEKLEYKLVHFSAVSRKYNNRGQLDAKLKSRLDNISSLFERLTRCVEAKRQYGTTKFVVESDVDVAEIKTLLAKLSARIEAFIYESMIRVEIAENAILTRLPTAEKKALEQELAIWNTTLKHITSTLAGWSVREAAYDVQPESTRCIPGTRVELLSTLVTWVKKDTAKGLLWLTGMTGTGKTSVAVTLCHMLDSDEDVLLGGAFLCSRTAHVEARTNVRRIIPTLAHLFAHQSPKFAVELAAELNSTSIDSGLADQIGPLLQRPLTRLNSETRPIVFVVDALDECGNERELTELLTAIAGINYDVNIKFILTSRPETHTLGKPILDEAQSDFLHLRMVEAAEVPKDIRFFINGAFAKEPFASPWYSDTDVTALATLSNGIWIFASTMVSYILGIESAMDRTDPLQATLAVTSEVQVVTEGMEPLQTTAAVETESHVAVGRRNRLQTALVAVSVRAVRIGPLDAMYEFILTQASGTAEAESEEPRMIRDNLACVLAVRVQISVISLAELLGRKVYALRQSLIRLHAMVYVPAEDDEPGVRIIHASFADYLVDRADINLRVSVAHGDKILAHGCLRVMQIGLHFNVSHSYSSYDPNLSEKPTSITPSLEYACLRWVYHLSRLAETSFLAKDVDNIFRPRFLFWLEVMSVLGRVQYAAAMLIVAAATIRLENLSRFLRDANYFIASSQDAIQRSAPHIYLSALPFAAKDSLIYKTFRQSYKGLVHVDTLGIDAHDRHLVMTLIGHESWVNAVAYSPNGQIFASGSTDGTVRIWDILTEAGRMSPLKSGDGAVNSVAIDPTGRHLASGTEAGVVCIWSLFDVQKSPQRLCRHAASVWCVVFSPDGLLLASASSDKTVLLGSFEENQDTLLLQHTHGVRTVAFSPDGQFLASGSDDNVIRLWSSATGKPVGEDMVGHLGSINTVCFSPDGVMLASGSDFDNIRIWDPRTGRNIVTLRGDPQFIRSIQFSPDGQLLVAADECSVNIWTLRQDPPEASSIVLDGHTGWVCCVTFSPDGKHIASASSDRTIRIWDAEKSQSAIQPLPAHRNAVNVVAVSLDGAIIVSGSTDRSIRLWKTSTGEPKLEPLLGHTDTVYSVAISADGLQVASASKDRTVRLWSTQTGKEIATILPRNAGKVNIVAFSPDSRWIALGSDNGTVHAWDVAKRQQTNLSRLECNGSVFTVAFSPSGRLLAVGDRGGHVHLWHVETGQWTRTFTANNNAIHSVAFSPSGEYIVSGGADAVVRIWNSSSGKEISILEGHTDRVLSVAYSPDGRIGSGSADGTVNLWEMTRSTPAFTLHGHKDWVQSVAFTPDDKSIVTCSADSTIRVWNTTPAPRLSSEYTENSITALALAGIKDGWLLGSKGELLLWVPADYQAYLHTSDCPILIGSHRVTLSEDPNGPFRGHEWNGCWKS